jgi:hypothetical protein
MVDATDLRNLDPVLALRREPEAIGTDNRAGMQDGTLADPAPVVDGDIRIEDLPSPILPRRRRSRTRRG